MTFPYTLSRIKIRNLPTSHIVIETHTSNLFGSLSFPGAYTLSVSGIMTSFPSEEGDISDIAFDDAVRRAPAARS